MWLWGIVKLITALKYLIAKHARLTFFNIFSTLLALIRSCSLNYFQHFSTLLSYYILLGTNFNFILKEKNYKKYLYRYNLWKGNFWRLRRSHLSIIGACIYLLALVPWILILDDNSLFNIIFSLFSSDWPISNNAHSTSLSK